MAGLSIALVYLQQCEDFARPCASLVRDDAEHQNVSITASFFAFEPGKAVRNSD
jgi:hypothetical protein